MGRAAYGGRSPEEYERMLLGKLELRSIRSTLCFAGLYQITHEMLKDAILVRVRDFYISGLGVNGDAREEARYQAAVIDAAKVEGRKVSKFEASVSWLARSEAITEAQAERLNEIYEHRHELTHELAAFIVDIDRNPDIQLFVDALNILRDIHRFWAQIEIDIGSFEHLGEVTVDDVTPASLILLQRCIEAWADLSEDADASGQTESSGPSTLSPTQRPRRQTFIAEHAGELHE